MSATQVAGPRTGLKGSEPICLRVGGDDPCAANTP